MRDVIPFMVIIKEVWFIFNIRISDPEVFFKYSKITKVVLSSWNITIFCWEQNTLLLSIIVYEYSSKRNLFGCVTLIQDNKQHIFLLIHSTKHYSLILEESYLDGETFSSTKVSLIIHTSNSNPQPIQLEVAVRVLKCLRKVFSIIKTYHSHSNIFHHLNVRFLARSGWP